jgi:hypothetical protein
MTSEIDIVENLHCADPEETPSAAKIVMARAAGEIEHLRNRVERMRELLNIVVDYADRSDDSGAPLVAKDIRKVLASNK